MPRMNLTEEEAARIRAEREIAEAHRETWNRALDTALEALEPGLENHLEWAKDVLNKLRREPRS